MDSELCAIVEQWREMRKTSTEAFLLARAELNDVEASSRHAEACTLNVCIKGLSALLAQAGVEMEGGTLSVTGNFAAGASEHGSNGR